LAVAVRILGVEDLRDGDDDGALSPRLRRRRKAQAIEKDARAVVAIVAVIIGEHDHPTAGLAALLEAAADAGRIIVHLDDPEPPLLVPIERDRIADEGLGRRELDTEAGANVEGSPSSIRRARASLDLREERRERTAIDEVGKLRRVLVLEPKRPTPEPKPVLSAIRAHDRRDVGKLIRGGRTALAFDRHARETPFEGVEEIEPVAFRVREENVELSILVGVDQTKAGVASFRIDDGALRGQIVGQSPPAALARLPSEDRATTATAGDKLAPAVAVEIAKTHAEVDAVLRGLDGSAVDHEPVEERIVPRKASALEPPRARFALGSPEDHRLAVDHAETDARVAPTGRRLRIDDRDRELGLAPLASPWVPEPHHKPALVRDDDILETVAIEIENADAVVIAVRRAEPLAAKEGAAQTLIGIAKGEEADASAVSRGRVVDQLDDLIVSDPTVRMEDERERPSLAN